MMQRRLLLAALALAVAAPGPALAAPEKRKLTYVIMRNGSQIGQHEVDLTVDGKTTTVDYRTRIEVKVMFIPAYTFSYTGREVWTDNAFSNFRSQTDDNGTKHSVTATAAADKVAVVADGKRADAPKGVIPASFWNTAFATRTEFFNTENGQLLQVKVADMGLEQIQTKAGPKQAKHYRLTGGLERDLWFDTNGTPLRFQLKGSDGSIITSESTQ